MAAPLIACLEGAQDKIVKMEASSRFLAFGSTDNCLYIADLEEFYVKQRFEFDDTVTWLHFLTDNLLAASSLDGKLSYFVLEDGEFKQRAAQYCSQLAKFVFHKHRICAISEDSLVYVVNARDLGIQNVITADNVYDVAALSDEHVVFAGGALQLYNLKQNAVCDRFERQNYAFITVVAFGDTVFASTDGGEFLAFSVRGGKLYRVQAAFEGVGEHVLDVQQFAINGYAFYCLGCGSSLVCLEKNLQLRYQNNLNAGVTLVRQYKNYAICGCSDGEVIVFDALSGYKVCNFEAVVYENESDEEQIPVNDLCIVCDRLFVTGDKYIYVYSLDFEQLAEQQQKLDQESLSDPGESARIEE